jgi:hypothetical protein
MKSKQGKNLRVLALLLFPRLSDGSAYVESVAYSEQNRLDLAQDLAQS